MRKMARKTDGTRWWSMIMSDGRMMKRRREERRERKRESANSYGGGLHELAPPLPPIQLGNLLSPLEYQDQHFGAAFDYFI